jgi:hypothetical protein
MSNDFQDYPVNDQLSLARQDMQIETFEQFAPHSVAFAATEDEDGDYVIDRKHPEYQNNVEILHRWLTRVSALKEGGANAELPTERRLKMVASEAMQSSQSRLSEERGEYAHSVLPCKTNSGQFLFKRLLVYDANSKIDPIRKHYDWMIEDAAKNGI